MMTRIAVERSTILRSSLAMLRCAVFFISSSAVLLAAVLERLVPGNANPVPGDPIRHPGWSL